MKISWTGHRRRPHRTGGWHRRYARVLLVEHDGERAGAGGRDGDGTELEARVLVPRRGRRVAGRLDLGPRRAALLAENRRLRREIGDAEAVRRITSDAGDGRTFTRGELAEAWEIETLPIGRSSTCSKNQPGTCRSIPRSRPTAGRLRSPSPVRRTSPSGERPGWAHREPSESELARIGWRDAGFVRCQVLC